MPVDSKHPLYQKRVGQWEIMRDCYEGEDAIKGKGEKYLPRATGSTPYQYEAYKTRARWVNYVGRTLNGLHGLMFRRNPVLSCPEEFRKSGIVENADRRGRSLNQFVADSVHDMMITSFGGFLADLPAAESGISVLEAERRQLRPYMRYYAAESIINWRTDIVDSIEKLTMVVLREEFELPDVDEFAHEKGVRYRVLELKDGIYRQRIITKVGDLTDERIVPVVVRGGGIDYIPFSFAPSDKPDRPMLMDLAWCNIGHYQKSADYENGVHLTTIPTGYVTGHGQDTDEATGEREILNLGGDSFLMFPEAEAKVGTLVYAGEGLTHSEKALEMAMSEMAVLGSRLVSPDKNVSETADAAKIHRAGENALLATFAKNVSDCVTRALSWISEWMGIEGTLRYDLTTDYDTLSFDANALNALANLDYKMPLPYLYGNLADGEYMPSDSSLEEYVVLTQMEKNGADPLDIYRAYKAMRNGVGNVDKFVEKKVEKSNENEKIIDNDLTTENKEF